MSIYKNAAGYADPTAGAAISKMMREYRMEQKKERRRKDAIMRRGKVYVVSKYAGNIPTNVHNAKRYCRFVTKQKRIPFASHLIYPLFLKDDSPKERELGLLFGLVWLALCDEVWCFGTELSTGMQAEVHEAKRLKKPIRYFTENMEELTYEDDR